MNCDILIRGGEVIDPSQNLRGVRDIAISEGKIAEVAEDLQSVEARHRIDARDLYVVPGLIDLHVHVYPHSPFGLDPDPLCAAGGVTTMLDTGSAGSNNFEAFRRDTIDRAETRIFGLVNLSCIGLVSFREGELMDRRYADADGVVEIIKKHGDIALGVKIRASRHIIGEGEQGWANFHDAVRAARESGTWLMVHIGECPMSIPDMLEHLEAGDCITHCYKGGSTRILDDGNRVWDAVRAARERGVIFDVGHGYGSFQWEVVEAAVEDGFPPTTISTDLHTMNLHGPVYDMPTTMSKFLHLGLSLDQVVALSTVEPARVLRREGEIGTLRVGSTADIAVLEKREGRFLFTDSYGQDRTGSKLLSAAATIRGGKLLPGGGGLRMRHLAQD
jgi:dihydroorotase